MTKALLEWETLDADQISDIMDGKPPRPPKPSGRLAETLQARERAVRSPPGETAPARAHRGRTYAAT